MKAAAMAAELQADDCSLYTERLLPAPPAAVFEAFRDPARLARWWGPNGFTNTFERFELKPGGEWRFTMHGPDGTDYPNHSVFIEVEPARRLVMEHRCPPFFRMTMLFEDRAQGTLLRWLMRFDDAKTRADVRGANEQNMDRLTAVLLEG